LEANLERKSCLLSGGAPDSPMHHRTLSGARFPSRNGAVDRCSPGAVGAPDTIRCTPDSPVPPSDRWLGHVSRIARPTVGLADRWLTGQSGEPPDSPVNYSRTPPASPESGLFTRVQPGAPDTVRCTTGQSGVPSRAESWLNTSKPFALLSFLILLFLTLRQVY
jgi:hypothetical protein